MAVSAVLFDLDETLIEEEAVNDAVAMRVCKMAAARRGVDPAALFAAMRARSLELWRAGPAFDYCLAIGISAREGLWGEFAGADPNLATLRRWREHYRVESWRRALADCAVADDALAIELSSEFARERRLRHVVFPESERIIRGLAGRFHLGLITDGAPDIQRAKLAGCGLGGYFETVAVSGELGFGKPDVAIFEFALGALKVAARDAVMVGDSLRRDIGGARGVGMHTIWINRAGRAALEGGARFDAEIRTLDGLPEILLRMSGR